MEELPPNLDDGELWLPSDIFPTDEVHYNNHIHNHYHDYNQIHLDRQLVVSGSSLDDLNRQFTNLNFRDQNLFTDTQLPKVPPYSQLGMFGPKSQYALTTTATNGCFGLTVDPTFDHDHFIFRQTGPLHPTPDRPVCYYDLLKSVPSLVAEQLMETRTVTSSNSRPVHGLPNRLMHKPSPFQDEPIKLRCSIRNFRGPTSGTGVFIPRSTSSSRTVDFDAARLQLTGVITQRGPAKTLRVGRAQDYHYHHQVPSSQVSLPKDWSY